MEDALVAMLDIISQGVTDGSLNNLLKSPLAFNSDLYNAAVTIHNVVVKPVTAIVLAIMFTLSLASTSARAEGDRELGVRIIAATLFKIAMVFTIAQSAVLLLNGLSDVAVFLINGANQVDVGAGSGATSQLGDQMRPAIAELNMAEQLLGIILLILPWIVTLVASLAVIVVVFFRFLQMYLLMAFASLPIAFLGHEDTKSIGIGYLKTFASVALSGAVIVISMKMYQALASGWMSEVPDFSGDVLIFILSNVGKLLVSPIVLIILVFTANGLSKKLVGEG